MYSSVQNPAYLADLQARFRVAARHSLYVRVLRVAVPAGVALSLAAVVAISIFNPFRALANLPLDVGNVVVSGTKITMESPHLSGFTADKRPYELWAKAATQDLKSPDNVDLSALHAKVEMQDDTSVVMDARAGYFNTKTQLLDLRKEVFLQSSAGYEMRMTSALVNMDKGTVTSDEPVSVKLLNGSLAANRLRITERGDIVLFDGGVSMSLLLDKPLIDRPDDGTPEPADDADSTAAAPSPARRPTRTP